ncbi:MAG TPA: T9SS type A sorting domain-containing protein [Bacteroidia bacterium]|nr:T9SS type A sorting domain-containing protein [Bacteroidia bacterium]
MKSYFLNKISSVVLIICSIFISQDAFSQSDLCSGAVSIADNTSCVATNYNVQKAFGNEIASPACATSDRDGWFTFTAAASVVYTITGTSNDQDLGMAVYTGCAASNLVAGTCVNATGLLGTETTTFTATIGQVYYLRMFKVNSANKKLTGTVCVYHATTPPANDACSGATTVSCAGTYTGSTILATSTGDPAGTCGTTAGTPGVWYKFTGNGQIITASLCGSSYDTKIQVYSGTCGSLSCVSGNDDFCGTSSQVTWTSTNAVDYYIFVGGFGGATGTYSLTMSCASLGVPNCAVKTSPANGSTLTCSSTNFTWNAPVGGSPPTQYLLYFGTDAGATNINNGTNIGNVLNYSPPALLNNTTYYWNIVPQNAAGSATGCTTFSFTTGGANPANDVCGGALPLTSGVTINDDNSCATDEAPLAAGSCWSTGSVNSLWYSVSVPASGILSVLTSSLTLANTQIAVYSGSCASLTEIACNDDAPGAGCGAAATSNSQLNLTGLAAGTYYIRVDGRLSTTGTYNIMASTTGGVGTAIGIAGSDCSLPITYCSFPVTIPDPGYKNTGNICDFTGTGNCLAAGEQNALWIKFTALTAGALAFNIIPNDYTGCDLDSDYDWVLYRTTGAGATTCANIKSTGGDGELACNYSYQGVTGMSSALNAGTAGNQPLTGSSGFTINPGVGCYNAGYEPSITAAVGDVFILVVQNYASTNIGFNLTIPTGVGFASVGNTAVSPVFWTGSAASSTFSNTTNWSNCTVPSCSPAYDAIVLAGPSFQPIVNINTSVKSMTINPSATLTVNSGVVLDVCGDFVNNGQLRCAAGSTINFSGTSNQIITGNLTGVNKFSNLTVNKTAGVVTLGTNVEVGQDFKTVNATSIVNTSGTDFVIGRDFVNSNGSTTFTGITSTSSFIFNGSSAQVYNPNANAATPSLTLCSVTMSNTSTGVTLSTTNTPNLILNSTGVLTLNSGKIVTPGSQEVIVTNTGNTAVSSGNTTSYVEGNLRRYLAAGATGPFDFPVGHATPGYERANINFTSAAAAGAINLLARFDSWGGSFPLPSIPNWSECSTTYNLNYLNHGYWSIDASAPSTGNYNITLYNRGYSNATGSGFSVAKSPSSSPSWTLAGNCVSSPATATIRNGVSGFSKFSTVQGTLPLPVELISFDGISANSYNNIFWKSAVEINFHHYELESSENGTSFSRIADIQPIGNQNSINSYEYLDFNFFKPITYYRLKMVDQDNSFRYSNVIAIEYGSIKENKITVYPNPASNELYISLLSSNQKNAAINIFDIYGRVLYKQELDLSNGFENAYINTSEFASGTYIVNVTFDDSKSENIKVIINSTK